MVSMATRVLCRFFLLLGGYALPERKQVSEVHSLKMGWGLNRTEMEPPHLLFWL